MKLPHQGGETTPRPPGRSAWLTLALLGVIAFTGGVGRRNVFATHEARVVETAVTMLRSGPPWHARPVVAAVPEALAEGGRLSVNPWLVPVFEGEVRLQKPPLPYWTSAAMMWLLGERPLAVRLVPGLLGALGTLLVADLARRLFGRRYFLPTGLAWASSYFVLDGYREITTDPFLAGTSLLALWAYVAAGRRWGIWLVFYVALALGGLAKGPVILLHVAVPALLLLYTHRLRPRGPLWAHLLGAAAFLLIALPWPLLVWFKVPGALELWRFESVGRLIDNEHKPASWWFYGPVLLGNSLPWTPLWLLAVAAVGTTWRRLLGPWSPARRRWLPVLWMLAVTLVFSLSSNKKAAYLLPLMPAVALLSGVGIVQLGRLARRRDRDPAAGLRLIQALIGLAFAVVVAVLIVTIREPDATRAVDVAERVVLACVVIGFAVLPLRRLRPTSRPQREAWLLTQTVAYSLAITLLLAGPDAIKSNRKPPRAFADAAAIDQ